MRPAKDESASGSAINAVRNAQTKVRGQRQN